MWGNHLLLLLLLLALEMQLIRMLQPMARHLCGALPPGGRSAVCVHRRLHFRRTEALTAGACPRLRRTLLLLLLSPLGVIIHREARRRLCT